MAKGKKPAAGASPSAPLEEGAPPAAYPAEPVPGYSDVLAEPAEKHGVQPVSLEEEDIIDENDIRRKSEGMRVTRTQRKFGIYQWVLGNEYHITLPGWAKSTVEDYVDADGVVYKNADKDGVEENKRLKRVKLQPDEIYLKPEVLYRLGAGDSVTHSLEGSRNATYIDLSQRNIDDWAFNLMDFHNLAWLVLQGNLIENPSRMNLHFCKGLRSLDLSDNKISDISILVQFLETVPWLVSLQLKGNPITTKLKDYRFSIVLRMPGLRTTDFKLRFIDGAEITVKMIANAWKYCNGDSEEIERYKFYMSAHRALPPGETAKDLDVLDLGNRQLRHLDFSLLKNLTKIIMPANHITSMALARSNIQCCVSIEVLDLRSNDIDELLLLAAITDDAPLLTNFSYSNNPCFKRDNKTNRHEFLSHSAKNASLDYPHLVLNGHKLTPLERAAAIPNAVMGPMERENWMFLLSFHQVKHSQLPKTRVLGPGEAVKQANMSDECLVLLGDMRCMQQVEYLDLSENRLWTFRGSNFWSLRMLRYLDLRWNNFKSLEMVITELQGLHELKTLYLLECTRTGRTDHPEKYTDYVCGYLRGLEYLDDNENPNPLTSEQYDAVEGLKALCRNDYRVGPNTLRNLDLRGCGLKESDFVELVMFLAYLPVEHIRVDNNKMCNVPFYRLAMVENMPTLKSINGAVVTIEEKSAALKLMRSVTVERLVEDSPAYALSRKRLVETKEQDGRFGDIDGTKDVMLLLASGNSLSGVEEGVGQEAAAEFESLVETAGECVVGGFGESERGLGAFPQDWLPKVEVVLSLMQNFALIMMTKLAWPSLLLKLFSWLTIFSLDLEVVYNVFNYNTRYHGEMYWKMGIMLIFPLIFVAFYCYKASGFNFRNITKDDRKVDELGDHYNKVRCYTNMLFATICFFSVAVTWFFVVYLYAHFAHQDDAMKKGVALAALVFGIVGIVFFTTCCMGFVFYAKNPEEGFWFFLLIFEKRIVYFMLFLLYLPCVRILCLPFEMNGPSDAPDCNLKYFPDTPCSGPLGWPIVQWVAVVLLPIYLLATPIWFIIMATYGSKQLNEATGLDESFYTIKQFRNAHGRKRRDVQVLCDDRMRKLEHRWQRMAKHFPLAQTYLFSSYRYGFRYFKVVLLCEKLLLLTFIETEWPDEGFWNHLVVILIVSFGYLFSFLCRPYASDVEDWCDILIRFCLVFTVFIGLFNEQLIEHPDAATIMGILSLFITVLNVIVLSCAVVILIRSCCMRNRALPFQFVRDITSEKMFSLPNTRRYDEESATRK